MERRDLLIPLQRQKHSQIPEQQTVSSKTEGVLLSDGLSKLGEFRDYQIDLALTESIEGYQLNRQTDFYQVKTYLQKWVGRIMDDVTKSAFHGYFSKQMS
jgi:hypothetical protein